MNTSSTATKELTSGIVAPSPRHINGSEQINPSEKITEVKGLDQADTTIASREEADEIVEALYELPEMLQTALSFQVDAESDSVVIKVIDKRNDQVIRQIPNEDILKLREKMDEITGLLLNKSV